jgi:hypothetical protein
VTLEGLNEDFRDVLAALTDAGVEFLVVGAFALALHGAPRASGDIDLLARPTPDNARRVHAALRSFGAPLDAHGIRPDDFARAGTVYQIGIPPRRIDVLTQISGVDFEEAWASRVATTIDGRTVFFIGRDAYLKNKRAAGRPKDLADAARLEATSTDDP